MAFCDWPGLDCAPCPPNFVADVYDIFINTAIGSNLTTVDIEAIRLRCAIDIPTTTTTTTTTTTVVPSTTPLTSPSTTEQQTPVTSQTPDSQTSADHVITPISTDTSSTASTGSSIIPTSTSQLYNNSTSSFKTPQTTSDSSVYSKTFSSVTNSFNTQTTDNVTSRVENVTSAVDIGGSREERTPLITCHEVCITGVITGLLCVLVITAAVISIIFRKSRGRTEKRERGRSKHKFDNMPNVDFYNSIDVDETPSNRNSRSSFIRSSSDFSRNTPVVFDNPGYRRSFELRPNRQSTFRSNWYDPDATNFEYSQTNANLVAHKQKQNNRKGRSVSSSRLYDKNVNGNPEVIVQERRSFREYVPKLFKGDRADILGSDSPYCSYNTDSGVTLNGGRSLPRTPLESPHVNYNQDPLPRFKQSYRSRSFDPDLGRGESLHRPEPDFSTVDNRRRSKRHKKQSARDNEIYSKIDKRSTKSQSQKLTGNGAHIDKLHRSYSTERADKYHAYPDGFPDSNILSSNLQAGTYVVVHLEPGASRERGRQGNRELRRCRERSPSIEHNGHRSYGVAYRPNEIFMFQTKL